MAEADGTKPFEVHSLPLPFDLRDGSQSRPSWRRVDATLEEPKSSRHALPSLEGSTRACQLLYATVLSSLEAEDDLPACL